MAPVDCWRMRMGRRHTDRTKRLVTGTERNDLHKGHQNDDDQTTQDCTHKMIHGSGARTERRQPQGIGSWVEGEEEQGREYLRGKNRWIENNSRRSDCPGASDRVGIPFPLDCSNRLRPYRQAGQACNRQNTWVRSQVELGKKHRGILAERSETGWAVSRCGYPLHTHTRRPIPCGSRAGTPGRQEDQSRCHTSVWLGGPPRP